MEAIGPEREYLTFKYRPNFGFTIFINVLIYLIFLGLGEFQYFLMPQLYIGSVITIVIPLLIAFSRKIQITNLGITVSNLWGLEKTEVRWDEIDEGFIVSKSVREKREESSTKTGAYSEMEWLTERMLGTVVRLIVEMRNPIIINTRNIKQSKEMIEIIEANVKIQPNF